MKRCSKCKEFNPLENFSKKSKAKDGLDSWCKRCSRANSKRQRNREEYNARQKEYLKMNIEKTLLYSARIRAARYGLDCSITENDIVIPKHCPILGIEIFRGVGSAHHGSPSLDRIIPQLGYVPGNIQVISYKANTMKSDATIKELVSFAKWVNDNMELLTSIAGSEFQE